MVYNEIKSPQIRIYLMILRLLQTIYAHHAPKSLKLGAQVYKLGQ